MADEAKSAGRLERVLRAGEFAITAEMGPPDSVDPADVLAHAGCLKGLADAVNVLDGAGARAHLSPLATAAILVREGIEPVLQFTMRDRNRLALQADVLGRRRSACTACSASPAIRWTPAISRRRSRSST